MATLIAKPGERLRVPVRIEHGGPNVVELAIEDTPDELTAINKKAVVTIDGVRDKLKVLLVSGEPHAGERMWRNLLKSDANVDLVHFTILRPPEKQDGTPINELSLIAFPTADLFGRKIKEFDLIVFDRYSNQSVLPMIYFDNIVRYVREGGALLLAAGPDFSGPDGLYYSPLGRIAPARPDGGLTESPFRAAISKEGAKHPVTRGLPGADQTPPAWSPWFRQVNAEVTRGASILDGADQKPLLVLSREGKGRVALLLSDQMWLWSRGFEGGGPYLDLLRRLAHWLMKEPELEEEALRANVRGQKIEIERQSLLAEVPPVKVTAPSGKEMSVTLSPGRARTLARQRRRRRAWPLSPRAMGRCRCSPMSDRKIRASSRMSFRPPSDCARSPRRPAARCGGSGMAPMATLRCHASWPCAKARSMAARTMPRSGATARAKSKASASRRWRSACRAARPAWQRGGGLALRGARGKKAVREGDLRRRDFPAA